MAIEKIKINNFKSLVDITIEKPNPFTVFVGPNASGKSNIFEALEFFSFIGRFGFRETISSFFDKESIINYNNPNNGLLIEISFENLETSFST